MNQKSGLLSAFVLCRPSVCLGHSLCVAALVLIMSMVCGRKEQAFGQSSSSSDPKQALQAYLAQYNTLLPKPITVVYRWDSVYTGGPKKGQPFTQWTKRRYLAMRVQDDKTRIESADLSAVVKGGGDPQSTTHAAMVVIQVPYLEVKADTKEEVLAKPFDTQRVRDRGQPGWLWFSNGRWGHAGKPFDFYPFNLAAPPPWSAEYLKSQGYTAVEQVE